MKTKKILIIVFLMSLSSCSETITKEYIGNAYFDESCFRSLRYLLEYHIEFEHYDTITNFQFDSDENHPAKFGINRLFEGDQITINCTGKKIKHRLIKNDFVFEPYYTYEETIIDMHVDEYPSLDPDINHEFSLFKFTYNPDVHDAYNQYAGLTIETTFDDGYGNIPNAYWSQRHLPLAVVTKGIEMQKISDLGKTEFYGYSRYSISKNSDGVPVRRKLLLVHLENPLQTEYDWRILGI